MVVDLRDYKYLKDIVTFRLSLKQDKDIFDIVRDIAIPANIPLVVVAHYVAKQTDGLNPKFKEYISGLVEFYKYVDILGYDDI